MAAGGKARKALAGSGNCFVVLWAVGEDKTENRCWCSRGEEVYAVPVACSRSRPLVVTSVTRPGWLVARALPVRLCLTDQLSICQTVP